MRRLKPGEMRRSLALLVALASISVAKAGACNPDLTNYTPTPTLSWSQTNHSNTAGFRVYWKHAEDTLWQGHVDLPVWPGDANSGPVWPGITEAWPLQRLIPTSEQRLLIDVQVVAYNAAKVEGTPTTILRICMPQIWTGGQYR